MVDSESLLGIGETIVIKATGKNVKGEPLALENIEWTMSESGVGVLNNTDTDEVEFKGIGGNVRLTITAQDDVSAFVDLTVADVEQAVIPGYPFKSQADGFNAKNLDGNADKRGYDLTKIASSWNDEGHWLEWEISIPAKDDYFFVMRYASGKEPADPRKRDLKLMNGDDEIILLEEILLERSGSSESFGRDAEGWNFYISDNTMSLDEGDEQVFRMENIGNDGEGVNVAWLGFIKIKPANVDLTDEQLISLVDKELGMSLTDW